MEVAVSWLYKRDATLRDPYETTLAARIHEPSFRKLVGDAVVAKARIIKDLGNIAVHQTRAVAPDKAITSVRELFHVAYWLTRTYARGTKPASGCQIASNSDPLFASNRDPFVKACAGSPPEPPRAAASAS